MVSCARSLLVPGTEFSGNQTGISALGRQALLPAPEDGRMFRLNISGPSARLLSWIPPSGHRILNAALHPTVLLRQPAESVESCFLSGIRSSSYVDAHKLAQYRNLISRFFHARNGIGIALLQKGVTGYDHIYQTLPGNHPDLSPAENVPTPSPCVSVTIPVPP